jgi:hypothetical protein
MQATIEFVSSYVAQQVNQLDLTPRVSLAMHAKLIPLAYLDRVAEIEAQATAILSEELGPIAQNESAANQNKTAASHGLRASRTAAPGRVCISNGTNAGTGGH